MAEPFAIVEAFDRVDYGGYGRGAEAFPGVCSQPRTDITKASNGRREFDPTPDVTAGPTTRYINVQSSSLWWTLVYAGPASGSDADKQANAVLIPSVGAYKTMSRMITVEPGDVVHVWDHPGFA